MDIQTMALLLGVVNILLAVVLVVQYRLSPDRPGLGWWALGQTCAAIGLVIGNLRGASFVGHLAIVVYQVLLTLSPLLIYVGIKKFFGKPVPRTPIVALLVAVFVSATTLTLVVDVFVARAALLFLALAVGLAMAASAAIRDRTPDVNGPALFLGWVLGLSSFLYLLSGLRQAFQPEPVTVFDPSALLTASYLVEISSAVLWTFGMVLMLNQRLAAEVRNEATNLRTVFGAIPDCVVISRMSDGRVVDVNPGFSRLSGYTEEEAVDGFRATALWADPEGRERMVSALRTTGACQDMRVRMLCKDGSEVECVLNARVLEMDTQPHVVSVTRDITEELALQEQLRLDATTDALTGTANRRHFLALADAAIAESHHERESVAIAMLDLDRLKEINDNLGHRNGDAAIRSFAAAISAGLPEVVPAQGVVKRCVLGRLGGDEFGLLLPGMDAASGLAVVEGLLHMMANSQQKSGQAPITLTFSAGVSEYGGAGDSVDAMLARADSAMYQAKHQGRSQVVQADSSRSQAIADGVTDSPTQ